MDCRLKTMPYEIDGHELTLSCNMNVLADLQEQYGDVEELLDSERSMRSYLRLLAAMINNALREQGKAASYTAEALGQRIGFREFRRTSGDVFALLVSSVIDPDAPEEAAQPEEKAPEESEKNAVTSEDDRTASTSPGI
jgi:hypothetical protein